MSLVDPEEVCGPERAEWYMMMPLEPWKQAEQQWTTYSALGRTLDPEPGSQSPFFDANEWRELSAHGRASIALLATALVGITFAVVTNLCCAETTDHPNRVATEAAFRSVVVPLVTKCCLDCHDEGGEADVFLHQLDNPDNILKNRKTWERVFQQLSIDGMPPHDYDPRLATAERLALRHWLDLKLHYVDCSKVDDPGRVTVRRLNRTEYNNTIRDLLGIDIEPAADFPSDDVGYGFRNIGDAQSLPPLLFEKYMAAAERVAITAIRTVPLNEEKRRWNADDMKRTGAATSSDGGFTSMASNGSVYVEPAIQIEGEFILRVEAMADQAGPELARMQIRVDGQPVKTHEIRGYRQAGVYETRQTLNEGTHRIEAAFINDYYMPTAQNPRDRDRNLRVGFLELQGPMNLTWPASHQRIVVSHPSKSKTPRQAATDVFATLLPRAYRRPVTREETDQIVRLVELAMSRGESFERGIQVGLQGVLVSPHFLFRIEYDPKPNDVHVVHSIGDYELASRLSYFLWSTMPDATLFDRAASGTLHEPAVLDSEITRMLNDPKADALVDDFATQWLNLDNLEEVKPDAKLFPEFTPELRADLIRETQLFIRAIFRENRSLLEILDADFTFANERVARHYGIQSVRGESFRRVSLPASQRSGVLTHASILTLTSNPNRTSLVRRGKWILDNVLGIDLPDPPPGVPSLEDGAKESGAKTLREQLKIHRAMPTCASCHNTLDPLGFGFENFDAIGRWRDESEGMPVDSSGTLPGGETFRGPIELVSILKKSQRDFAKVVTKKMLTYALGRGLDRADSCTIDDIVDDLEANDYRVNVLIREIIYSRPFRMRRGDSGGE